MKKILSILIVSILVLNNFLIPNSYSVDTNSLNTPWTQEKATHLARKALYGATPEKVQEFLNAGSAENAVNILFPSIEGPDRTDFNLKMQDFLDLDLGKSENRNKFYMAKKILDPYEAKSKLFMIFEDTFSANIDTGKDITMSDIESTHDLLYSHTLGNYKEMIKRNLYNNGNSGDYSLSQFLDLLDQTNPKKPNQNYSRELLQLLLMLEYIPTESETTGDERNYTEEDVNSLALILFGFESDNETHLVTYNNNLNTNTSVEFLDGELKLGDSFDFYNSGSGTIDIQKLKDIRNGNNGLPDNIIDYIFSKREYEISMFLADKLYRFYVAENPSREELDLISSQIINNNFEIFPSIKWLLASDIMYSDKSMNSVIYKNPIDLSIGSYKKLGIDYKNINTSTLTDLEWSPYYPGSIFGRQGFDENGLFFKANNATKWIKSASILSEKVDIDNFINLQESDTASDIVDKMEEKIYLGRKLDNQTRNDLIKFLTTDENGNSIEVNINDNNYKNYYLKGLINLMIIQPEYILLSGYDKASNSLGAIDPFYTDDSKLIIIKSYGGNDWLHSIVPKYEYEEYLENRSTGSLLEEDLLSLNDEYYINKSMSGFLDLYTNGNLKIINRVGTPSHSRGHDSASRKITSQNNLYSEDEGIIGHFIKNENPVKTMVMGTRKPLELRAGNYLNITSNTIYSISDSTSNDFKEYKIKTIKDIYNSRSYPSNLTEIFKNSVIINDVSNNSKENGGRPGSGYNMEQNFAFIEGLFDSNITNVVSMSADGGYDTHRNQKDYLTNNLKKVSNAISDYFNRVKDKQDITILVYSEFGRTNKLNASLGTDHGMGGGMFVITNNEKLKENLNKDIYGNLSFKNSDNNWLGVGIDYRSVYTSVLESLYDVEISEDIKGEFDINKYIDKEKSDVDTLEIRFSNGSTNKNAVKMLFNINDKNFIPSQASYIKFEYGRDKENMYEYSNYYMRKYMSIENNKVSLRIENTDPGIKYYYKVTIYDNQYNEQIIEGDFVSPKLTTQKIVSTDENTRFNSYNVKFQGDLNFKNQTYSGLTLSDSGTTVLSLDGKNKIIASEGTFIEKATSTGSSTWFGSFILPKELDKDFFLKNDASFLENKLMDKKISKLVQVGSDIVGMGFKLNKEVEIELSDLENNKDYLVLTSQDGNNWSEIGKVKGNDNKIKFKTDHFSYFLVLETDSNGNLIDINYTEEEEDVVVNEPRRSSGGGGYPTLKKDNCPYGDYSYSYYDKTCGVDPSLMDPSHGRQGNMPIINMYNDLRNDLNIVEVPYEYTYDYNSETEMKLAELSYLELKINDDNIKAETFEEVFQRQENDIIIGNLENIDDNLKDKKAVLLLLREKLSHVYIGEYGIIHIKESDINWKFEKIAQLFISKNYSKEKTDKLINTLNKVIIYFAINEIESLEEEIKIKNKELLKKSIKDLVSEYKGNKVTTNKVINNKKETVKEKIERINKQIKDKKMQSN